MGGERIRILVLVVITAFATWFVLSSHKATPDKPKRAIASATVAKPTVKSSANHKPVIIKEDGVRVVGAVNLKFEK